MALEEKKVKQLTVGLVASIILVVIGFTSTVANARSTVEDAKGTRMLWLYLSADNDMLGNGIDWVGRHPDAANRSNAALAFESEESCLWMKNYGLDRGFMPNLINLCISIEVPTTYTKEELEAHRLLQNKRSRDIEKIFQQKK